MSLQLAASGRRMQAKVRWEMLRCSNYVYGVIINLVENSLTMPRAEVSGGMEAASAPGCGTSAVAGDDLIGLKSYDSARGRCQQ